MSCPFLKEGRARYCHAAPVQKLILEGPGAVDGGRCASPQYTQCALAAKSELQSNVTSDAQPVRCPHLEEIRVQYCGVSPVTKLVPFSDSELSNCTSNTYRFCDSYLSLARPHASAPPAHLLYSPNHFWMDAEESGMCHIGIDKFLAEVTGHVDGVTFVTPSGTHCPALALTVHGVEWPMSFPNPLMIQKVNSRVRRDPARLTADPYGAGWLFEGWELPGRTRAGLVSGAQAAAWQAEEQERLNQEIHETHAPGCDGGSPVRGIAQLLSRPDVVCLFQHFFSARGWTGEER
jgi:glycine cleavage system H lipoate-binding protein